MQAPQEWPRERHARQQQYGDCQRRQRHDVDDGNERFVPPDDPERNEKQAREALLDHVPVDEAKVFPMGADTGTGPAGAEAAAVHADRLGVLREDATRERSPDAERAAELTKELGKRDMLIKAEIILDNILEDRADIQINAIHMHSGLKADLYPVREGDELRQSAFQRRIQVDYGPPIGKVYIHSPEDLILYNSAEFGFVQIPDSLASGSSLMPQKKNPDVFELTRGKAGTLLGLLTGLLATLKGLPSTYDKDLQEDKAPVFQATDTLLAILPVLAGAVRTITVKVDRMRSAIDPTMMATDLADYLVNKGVPFRDAHAMAGKAVRAAGEGNVSLEKMSLEAYQAISLVFEADVYQVFDPMKSVEKRNAIGGTSPQSVTNQIQTARMKIKGD